MLRRYLTVSMLVFAWAAAASAQPASTGEYAWAAACKDCHSGHYAAWEKTKHANAITRLSSTEREGECVGCHVTGGPPLIEKDGVKDVNANVQCEQCHGPGKAHIAAAASGAAKPGAITRRPAESVCVDCHSNKSPKFKFFSYPALAPLIHQVAK